MASVFAAYPAPVRRKLSALRELVFATAKRTPGVGSLEETLKWGQPSYVTTETKSGSTIRLDAIPAVPGSFAIYFHCQTTLVETFKEKFGGKFCYKGNRALVFSANNRIPKAELTECIALALTYHLKKKEKRIPIGLLINKHSLKTLRGSGIQRVGAALRRDVARRAPQNRGIKPLQPPDSAKNRTQPSRGKLPVVQLTEDKSRG